jgi:hypothetical protein
MITKEELSRLIILGVYHNCTIFDSDAITGEFSERLALLTHKIMKQQNKTFKKLLVSEDVIVWPINLNFLGINIETLDKEQYNLVVETFFAKEQGVLPSKKEYVCIGCDENYFDGLLIGV